jgi:hypothetical protein
MIVASPKGSTIGPERKLPMLVVSELTRSLPAEIKQAIQVQLEDLPPIDFISDPDTVRLGNKDLVG